MKRYDTVLFETIPVPVPLNNIQPYSRAAVAFSVVVLQMEKQTWWTLSYKPILGVSLTYTTGELGYDGLNGTRKIGPSYAKSVVYI